MFTSVGREGIEPTLLIEERPFYRRLGLPSPIDPSIREWCRRDSNPQTLASKASRSTVGVPHQMKFEVGSAKCEISNFSLRNSDFLATHTGFEPVISAVTGQRPLLAGPMGR